MEAKQTFALVREAVQQWAEDKGVDMLRLDDAVDVRWSLVHGLITLAMAGTCRRPGSCQANFTGSHSRNAIRLEPSPT